MDPAERPNFELLQQKLLVGSKEEVKIQMRPLNEMGVVYQ
jgi:hypothetical protein